MPKREDFLLLFDIAQSGIRFLIILKTSHLSHSLKMQ